MKFSNILVITCVVFGSAVFADEQPAGFQECLQKDSIACVQMTIFRKAKEFFDQQNINLVGGLTIVKSADVAENDVNTADIEGARSVQDRENALENYVIASAKNFFQERSISWNFVSAARSLSNAIPDEIKENVRSLVVEGRGKKKILKKLLPILGLVKLKLVGLSILVLLGIGFIAKKAILISFISIAISGFLLLKKLLSKKMGGGGGGGHEEISYHGGGGGGGFGSGYGGGGGGWNSYEPHSFGGDYGSHSSPVGQSVAYSGHHKVARR